MHEKTVQRENNFVSLHDYESTPQLKFSDLILLTTIELYDVHVAFSHTYCTKISCKKVFKWKLNTKCFIIIREYTWIWSMEKISLY